MTSICWGEQYPSEETVRSWQVWKDEGGGSPVVEGYPDWGQIKISDTLPNLSSVEDLGSVS